MKTRTVKLSAVEDLYAVATDKPRGSIRDMISDVRDENPFFGMRISELANDCAMKRGLVGSLVYDGEVYGFFEVVNYALVNFCPVKKRRIPELEEEDLEEELEKMGASFEYRWGEFLRRFDSAGSPQFVKRIGDKCAAINEYTARVALTVICTVFDAMLEPAKIVIPVQAYEFASSKTEPHDMLAELRKESSIFEFWIQSTLVDSLAGKGYPFGGTRYLKALDRYFDTLNFVLKGVYHTLGGRLPVIAPVDENFAVRRSEIIDTFFHDVFYSLDMCDFSTLTFVATFREMLVKLPHPAQEQILSIFQIVLDAI